MKLSLFSSLNHPNLKSAYTSVLRHLCSSTSRNTHYNPAGSNSNSLYRRLTPIGDPNDSVVPVLDQWVNEGKPVDKFYLERTIAEFRRYRRYKHALEVSKWMTDKRYFPLTPQDAAARLFLIFKVHGIEEVEVYYKNLSKTMKDFNVMCSLLNCYAHGGYVEKAESIMQKAKDLGLIKTPLLYNIMMNLYYKTKNWEKCDSVMDEMKEMGISFDKFTLTVRLSAYAAASDAQGVDKIVNIIESHPNINLDSEIYGAAAGGYLKVGSVEKALEMLKKFEEKTTNNKEFTWLLNLYAETGVKEEIYRIWNSYKPFKIYNKGYVIMMRGLIKCGDIEGAEKIFEEWESKKLSYDFRIPDFLIDFYCRNGDLCKAEGLVKKGVESGGVPNVNTWYYLAGGYIMENQVEKAIEVLRKAVFVCPVNFNPSKDSLNKCVEYLELRADLEKMEEFMRFVKDEGLFSEVVCEKLFSVIKEEIYVKLNQSSIFI